MRVSVLKTARDDLKEIHGYLREFGELPPQKFRHSFEEFCSMIAGTPFMFPIYEYNRNYRKAALIYEYLVFYKVDEVSKAVKIYRVLHGKRNVVPLLEG